MSLRTVTLLLAAMAFFALPAKVHASTERLVYVADSVARTVTAFTLDGTPVGKLKGFSSPNAVAVGPGHDVYVLDHHTTVDVFKRGATKPFETLTPPSNYPGLIDVTVALDGTLYISDAYASDMSGNGIWVYPPGQNQPTLLATPLAFVEYLATDRAKNLFASFIPEGSDQPGVQENQRSLGFSMLDPLGVAIARNGDIVVCDAKVGIETYKPGQTKPSRTLAMPCADMSLAAHDSALYVTTGGHTVIRYAYPSGAVTQTLRGFRSAVSVAVDGARD
jgi:hypothetical protein